jgi:hypothetical protein
VCRVPTQRFGVEVEAAAVALRSPDEAYGSMRGERVALGLDLEWETDGPGGYRFRGLDRYEVPCRVRGRIRVGDEEIEFRGYGQRDHSWGARNWFTGAWCWNSGWLEDGTRFHSVAPRTLDGQDVPWAAGYVQPPGKPLEPIQTSRATEKLGAHGLPASGRIEVGDLHLDVSPLYFSPVLLRGPAGQVSRFPRCLARYSCEDGRRGLGWIEWNQPQQG